MCVHLFFSNTRLKPMSLVWTQRPPVLIAFFTNKRAITIIYTGYTIHGMHRNLVSKCNIMLHVIKSKKIFLQPLKSKKR